MPPNPQQAASELTTETSTHTPRGAVLGRMPRGLAHDVFEALSKQLRDKALKPGDKLPSESAIMQTFGVSRGVVREALSRLQAAGLVQTQHGIGTFALDGAPGNRFHMEARPMDGIEDTLDLLELRSSLESDAAGIAATRRTPEQLGEIRRALDAFEAHVASASETVGPDFQFHLAIAKATGNRYFADLMTQLGMAVIPRTRVSSTWLTGEQRQRHLQKVNQEHTDIFWAIERQDPEAAKAAMRLHLVNSRERQRAAYPPQTSPRF